MLVSYYRCFVKVSCWVSTIVLIACMGSVDATLHFASYDSSMAVKETDSKVILNNTAKVIGWSEFSIIKQFGKNAADGWVEQYPNGVTISRQGSQDPNTNLIVSNSNAINYGIKNNSNAIMNLPGGGAFTEEEKEDLLEDVRTHSNAFIYCCKNVSNALVYGLENNSNAIVALDPYLFSEGEKAEVLEDIRTTSNAFLCCCKNVSNALSYGLKNNSSAILSLQDNLVANVRTTSNAFLFCCKNASNALSYGIKNNSNAIIPFLISATFTEQEKAEIFEDVRTTSNAFLYCCKNSSNALSYGIKNNSNAIGLFQTGLVDNVRTTSNAFLYCCKNTSNALSYGIKNNSNAIMAFPLRICGPSICPPVSRLEDLDATAAELLRTDGGLSRYSCEQLTRKKISDAAWSPDQKYLAVIRESNSCENMFVYAYDHDTDNLTRVAHVQAEECVHISSVAWDNSGQYLALAIDHIDTGPDVYMYAFDKTKRTLEYLPGIDNFLKAF